MLCLQYNHIKKNKKKSSLLVTSYPLDPIKLTLFSWFLGFLPWNHLIRRYKDVLYILSVRDNKPLWITETDRLLHSSLDRIHKSLKDNCLTKLQNNSSHLMKNWFTSVFSGQLASALTQIDWKRMRLEGFWVLGIEPVTLYFAAQLLWAKHPKAACWMKLDVWLYMQNESRVSACLQPSEKDLHGKYLNDGFCQTYLMILSPWSYIFRYKNEHQPVKQRWAVSVRIL